MKLFQRSIRNPKSTIHNSLLFFVLIAVGLLLSAGLAWRQSIEPSSPVAMANIVAPVVTAAHSKPHLAAQPAVKPHADQSRKNQRAPSDPVFAEVKDGCFEVATSRYRATVTAKNGLTYLPKAIAPLAAEEESPQKIEVRFRSAMRGGETIYDRATDTGNAVAVKDGAGAVNFQRAMDFKERYAPRGDGVEQIFLLDAPPAGIGDLRFVCDLSLQGLTALPARSQRAGGLFFADAQGRVAARYGQVVARDAARHGTVIEPQLSADGQSVSFTVSAKWLNAATYPIEIDPLVGSDFPLTSLLPMPVGAPTIAASSTAYLAIWNDYRNGLTTPRLFASIVSASGTASGDFPISSLAGYPQDFYAQRIGAASDGSSWLVVWLDGRATGVGIYGSIISATGDVLGSSDFLIQRTTGTGFEDPLVTFNGSEYVVAWQDKPNGGTQQIYFTRVTPAGVVALMNGVPANVTPIHQALLFLAAQKPSGDTLLVYRENGETPAATRSVRIASDGNPRDPGGTTLFKEAEYDGGFGRPIGATWVNSEWHILSSFDQTKDSAIYLHRLSSTGVVTPPTGVFAIMGVSPISSLDQYAPAFAGTNEWLLVRNEKVSSSEYHLLGKRITFAGQDMDPIPFTIDTATAGVLRNAVAAQAFNFNSFLVTWLDGRNGAPQPGDACDIAAALVDATIAGSGGTALVPVAQASPTSGEAPLTVSFDASTSQGAYDKLLWDFGDGTSSTKTSVSHIYRSNGIYYAMLTLTKGAYTVYDRVMIMVGVGNIESTRVGTPTQNMDGMVPGLFINSVSLNLNFVLTGADKARVRGVLDAGQLPDSLASLTATVRIGDWSQSFQLDAKGQSASTDRQFVLDPHNGVFDFLAINTDLRTKLDAIGAHNETIKPAIIIEVPVTVTISTFSKTSIVGVLYRATKDQSGTGSYAFLGDGKEVSGSFQVQSFSAAEKVKTKLKVHTFSIKGRIVKPNGGKLKLSPVGELRFIIGNYSLGIPVGQFKDADDKLKFVARAGTSGLKKFSFNPKTGAFNLQMINVVAEGNGGSGLPVSSAGTNITKVDLNLSFIFDLKDEKFSAGRYAAIARKDSKAKKWKLR
ncbi:MAG: PKD domain-containing protein [Planctomycetota bacterium]